MESWLEIRPIPDTPGVSRREAEGAAWRATVRERLEGLVGRPGQRDDHLEITYNVNGAPVLGCGCGYIGVSHTRGRVAVVWSPGPCAVDIEHASRDVSRTASRFISAEEAALPDAAGLLFAISVWCAKEALYKYAGVSESGSVSGIDFLKDLRIVSSDLSSGRMVGTIRGSAPVVIELMFRDGLVVAVIR